MESFYAALRTKVYSLGIPYEQLPLQDLIQLSKAESLHKIEQRLHQIHSEFEGDIRRFEMEHARLKGETHDLMVRQEGINVRMQGMESTFHSLPFVPFVSLLHHLVEIQRHHPK